MGPSERNYYPNLDFLRFAAAGWVVLVHYFRIGPARDLTGYPPTEGALGLIAGYGYMGVCLFFVISGFVISLSAEKSTPASFIAGRVGRIMPGFVICMTLSALLIRMAGTSDAPGLATWAANLVLLPQLFGQPFVDGVYWSLVYEVIFYGWVALFVWLGLFARHLAAICWAWAAMAAADRLFLHQGVLERLFITEFAGFFIIGAAIYLLVRKDAGWSATALLVAGILLGVEGLSSFGVLYVNGVAVAEAPSLMTRLACTIAMVGTVLGALGARQVSRLAGVAFVAGGISYPLYLLHQEAGYAFLKLRPHWLSAEIAALGVAAAMLLLSWLVFRFAETPARRAIRPLLLRAVFFLRLGSKKGAAGTAPLA